MDARDKRGHDGLAKLGIVGHWMTTLKQYLENLDLDVDTSSLIDPRVDEIEATVCALPVVYKYYSEGRRSFFYKPQIRFTQQAELNDPFELGRRWQSESFRDATPFIMEKVQKGLSAFFSDAELISDALQAALRDRGIELSPQQKDMLGVLFQTPEGQTLVRAAREFAGTKLQPSMDYLLKNLEERFQRDVEKLISQWGIFSVSELPTSQLMWSHYAESGRGFVVGFDAQHPFFFSAAVPPKNLLRKVVYSDERVSNFWRNPYFLFLVKNSAWSYECEWRMMKELAECDEHRVVNGKNIFLCNIPRPIVKEIYFGYAYDASEIESDAREFSLDGDAPKLYRVDVNRLTGQLEPRPIRVS